MGLAVSSAFSDSSGDKISFYVSERDGEIHFEDDGAYLADLLATDIPIDQGQRGVLLDAILEQGGAHWDRDTFEIRSRSYALSDDVSSRAIDFMSSLIRVRDLELLTRESVRSAFRDDATAAIRAAFPGTFSIDENAPVSRDFSEFPADLVLRPTAAAPDAIPGAIYFVNNDAKLSEALLLQMEAHQKPGRQPFGVIAMLEDEQMRQISRKKFQRAQNRSLAMPIFRGDEDAAMAMIGRELRVS